MSSSSAPTRGRRILPLLVLALLAGAGLAAEPGAGTPLAELAARARRHHPLSRLLAAERRAAEAGVTTARAWRNPEVEVQAGRSRSRPDLGDADEDIGSIAIRQPLEWPGSRARRLDAAVAAGEASVVEAESALLDLEREVRQVAVDLVFQRRALALARAAQADTAGLLAVVRRRVEAGEASRSDLLRAQLEDGRAALDLAEHEREARSAFLHLGALCGELAADEPIALPADEPAMPAAAALGEAHPRLRHLRAVIRQRRAELAGERAARAPALTVGAFAEREAESDALGVSLGLELPLWNRNRGGIDQAGAALARAEAEYALVAAEIARASATAHREWVDAVARARRFDQDLRPASRDVLRLVLITYQANEAPILDLLDARRSAQEVEEDALAAERQAQSAAIALHYALGSFASPPHAGASP